VSDELPGLDVGAITDWLPAHTGLRAPFTFDLIAAGGSNLTYRVTDAAGTVVALRRPPVTAVLATAHDVGREFRILTALHTHTDVPVPTPLAECTDPGVTGGPFYVMDFVEGTILRTPDDSAPLTPDQHRRAADSLVDVQIAFHALDVDAAGLGDLARTRTDYVARQLRRWKAQVDDGRVREQPVLDAVHATLAASVPPDSGPPGLVHGDYRFDNTVLGPDGSVAAVLDWELATIGDPAADVAWSLCYWSDPGDTACFIDTSPTLDPAFPRRAEVVARYTARGDRDWSGLPWLEAFSWWKMGCIVEGVHARRLKGARGGASQSDPQTIAGRADAYLDRAAALVAALA